MTDLAVARVLHVLAVVLWIGGVGMVTTVLLPAIRRSTPANRRFSVFHAMEARFAWQARFTTVVAGASGFYMAWRLNAWDRFGTASFWWMHAMVLTWLIFTLMLFVIEPLFLERLLARRAAADPERTYRWIEWLHRCLLLLSLVTIAGAVAGSMGANLFDWKSEPDVFGLPADKGRNQHKVVAIPKDVNEARAFIHEHGLRSIRLTCSGYEPLESGTRQH